MKVDEDGDDNLGGDLYRARGGERSHVIGCCHTAFPPSVQEHPISGWANSLARRLSGLFWMATTVGHMLTFAPSDEPMQRFAQEGMILRQDQQTTCSGRGRSDEAQRQPSATCSFPAFSTPLRHPRPAMEVAGSHTSHTVPARTARNSADSIVLTTVHVHLRPARCPPWNASSLSEMRSLR